MYVYITKSQFYVVIKLPVPRSNPIVINLTNWYTRCTTFRQLCEYCFLNSYRLWDILLTFYRRFYCWNLVILLFSPQFFFWCATDLYWIPPVICWSNAYFFCLLQFFRTCLRFWDINFFTMGFATFSWTFGFQIK